MGRDSPLGMNTSSYRLDPSDLASYTEKKCFFGRLEDFWNNGRAVGVLDSAWEQHTFMDGQASPRGNEEEGAIQPSHPLSSPSPPAFNPSQHQSLFQ